MKYYCIGIKGTYLWYIVTFYLLRQNPKINVIAKIPVYRAISVGEGLDPPGDLQKQITIAERQSTVISFGNPENVNIFGREGQDPPLRFLSIDSPPKRDLLNTIGWVSF